MMFRTANRVSGWSSVVGLVWIIGFATLGASCSSRDTAPPNVGPSSVDDAGVKPSGADAAKKDTSGATPTADAAPGKADSAPAPACTKGAVKRALGQTCGCSEDCGSGQCVDGVCCNVKCDGACVACNIKGKEGECSPVPAGEADGVACMIEGQASCGRNGLCNGQGGCAKWEAGTECSAATCSGNSQVPKGVCDGQGACLKGTAVTCSPNLCKDAVCQLTCNADTDCAKDQKCDTVKHVCGDGKRSLGTMCTTNAQCKSGFCADGVCCDTACGDMCSYCSFPNSLGRCTAVPANVPDPRAKVTTTHTTKICREEAPNGTCGFTGKCDGSGGCLKWANGTKCTSETCDANTSVWKPDATCQNGVCKASEQKTCGAFKCNGSHCFNSCTTNDQCTAGNTCINGSCGKKQNGAACVDNAECASSVCSRGVCCNTQCEGTCFSCSLGGKIGTCSAVPNGQSDPMGRCVEEKAATCQNDGFCDGKGACRKYAAGTECAGQKCEKGQRQEISKCDGKGICVTGAGRQCNPYVCNAQGSDCYNSCTANGAECAPGQICKAGRCGDPLPKGGTCVEDLDCGSGLKCVDGVCCDSKTLSGDTCGTCKACNIAGSLGTCTNKSSDASDTRCPTDASSPCGNTGKCNGSGACAKTVKGVECQGKSCKDNGVVPAQVCDGAGACVAGSGGAVPCGANKCDSGACLSCLVSACPSGFMCNKDTGKCGKSPLGGSCVANTDCENNQCVDGVCCGTASCGECQECAPSTGACRNIEAGKQDPDNCVIDTSTNACGKTGCSGAGKCLYTASGKSCAVGTCSGATPTNSTCDGAGACKAAAGATCSGAMPLCRVLSDKAVCQGCSTDGDCGTGKVCSAGACVTCVDDVTATPTVPDRGCSTTAPVCSGGACAVCTGSGATSEGCGAKQQCSAGVCVAVLGTAGESCPCAAGLTCVDDVCCTTACGGVCERCSSKGICEGTVGDKDTCGAGLMCIAKGTCGECAVTADCGAGKVCSGDGKCVQCTPTAGCTLPQVCSTSAATANTCVACNVAKDCGTGACVANKCVECGGDADCTAAGKGHACLSTNVCVACTDDKHCDGSARCQTSTNKCVECLSSADCASKVGLTKCDLATNVCVVDDTPPPPADAAVQ